MPLGAVASWTDASGNGNSPAQGTGSAQPVNTAAAGPQASLPALVFTSANSQTLTLANALIGTKNFTVAIVGKVLSTAVSGVYASAGSAANGMEFGVDTRGTSRRDFNANGVVAISDTTSVASTSWEAWIMTSDNSGNLTLLINGAAHSLDTATATCNTPGALFSVGTLGGGSAFLNGSIFEVLVYATALSAGQQTSLYNYQHAITGL